MASGRVYMNVGLPGSGKSTWVRRQLAQPGHKLVVVSKDALRQMTWAGKYVYDKDRETLIQDMNLAAINIALKNDFDVIVDECHIDEKHRMQLVEPLRAMFEHDIQITYVMHTTDPEADQDKCIARRLKETKGIDNPERWADIIKEFVESYQEPTEYEVDFIDWITLPKDITL